MLLCLVPFIAVIVVRSFCCYYPRSYSGLYRGKSKYRLTNIKGITICTEACLHTVVKVIIESTLKRVWSLLLAVTII